MVFGAAKSNIAPPRGTSIAYLLERNVNSLIGEIKMKFWLLSLGLTLGILNMGESAHAFTTVYTDSNNKLSWSKKLPGTYSNGCVDANGQPDTSKCTFETLPDGSHQVKVDDSNAAIACKKIGARLPTESEFESLIRNFDHREKRYGPRLTDKGIADMQTVFGDMNYWFWSSSVSSYDSGVGYGLNGDYGGLAADVRNSLYAVCCVVGR